MIETSTRHAVIVQVLLIISSKQTQSKQCVYEVILVLSFKHIRGTL